MFVVGGTLFTIGAIGAAISLFKWATSKNSLDSSFWSLVLSASAVIVGIGSVMI